MSLGTVAIGSWQRGHFQHQKTRVQIQPSAILFSRLFATAPNGKGTTEEENEDGKCPF